MTAAAASDRYQVLGELASGGMARVYLGRQRGPAGWQRLVAIKRMHSHDAEDPRFAAMFLDEARVLARVQHPNVVPIIDFIADDDGAAIVMDFVPGVTLSRLLSRARAAATSLPVPVVSRVLVDCLEGLHAAHTARGEDGQSLGIVHRDVSPQNILIGEDGVARVLDFGIAHMAGRMGRTGHGELKGKLSYMSPEQIQQIGIDARSDVHALAIVAWECLTGRRLFEADDEAALYAQVKARAIAPLIPSATLPQALIDVIDAALAPTAADRPASARHMAEAIEGAVMLASRREVDAAMRALCGQDIDAQSRRVASLTSAAAPINAAPDRVSFFTNAEQPTAPLPGAQGTPPRRRASVAWLAAALLVIGGGTLMIARPWSTTPRSAAPPHKVPQTPPPQVKMKPEPAPSSVILEPPHAPAAPAPVPRKPTTKAAKRVVAPAHIDECENPFTVDKDGIRVPKPQCF
ncbi:MAG: protein kinase [Deltaproteobacteria bacterium]|nr:protein kinase [Deltaproteobacteria bacterium]